MDTKKISLHFARISVILFQLVQRINIVSQVVCIQFYLLRNETVKNLIKMNKSDFFKPFILTGWKGNLFITVQTVTLRDDSCKLYNNVSLLGRRFARAQITRLLTKFLRKLLSSGKTGITLMVYERKALQNFYNKS